jgi:glycerol-3-phosphate acyltransferase PlsY
MSVLQPYAELMFIGLLIFAYLFGSIPWGVILTRFFTREDIRQKGSGNIGATNVTREAGVLPGLLTLVGDVIKGAMPVYLTLMVFGPTDGHGAIYMSAVALAALLGHLYPVYLKFRDGGKGVATAAGSFAVISLPAVLAALILFTVMLFVARRVSVGSLSGAVALPIAIWFTTRSGAMTAAALLTALLLFMRHRENLKRLMAGTEPEFKRSRSMRR